MPIVKDPITIPELVGVIEQLLNTEPGLLTATTLLADVPGWDSMGVLLLMAELDERFGITLGETTLASLHDTSDIVAVVRNAGLLTE